jgi:putative sigma-54 modulation protein
MMRVNITFRRMEGTEAIKEHVTRKVERVRKYLQGPTEANVVMSVERHLHRCDVSISAAGWTFKGAEETEDMYTSVDKVMDKVERQIRKMKGREQDRKGPGASSARDAVEQLEQGELGVAGPTAEAVPVPIEGAGDSKEVSDGS